MTKSKKNKPKNENKPLESWIWDAACKVAGVVKTRDFGESDGKNFLEKEGIE
jgi:hypothetical protein